ncbi:MAG: electron transport complex subunit RsxC [Eubacteriaceae bacterium]|nr:electron transport complex subunit RsxC [Eubacteriaceae bacterium]
MNIKKATFKGGTHLSYNKELTSGLNVETSIPPEEIILPVSMHIGAPAKPIVEVGDKVKMGQKVAEATGFVSVPIHSSVSGEVIAIEPRLHPNGQKVLSIIIKNDMLDTPDENMHPNSDYKNLDSKEILNIIKEAGIVGLGGATFPTHVKLSIPEGKKVEYLILNAAECEAYLTNDDALMMTNSDDIIKGLEIVMYVLGIDKAYIGIEDNKKDAIEKMAKSAQALNVDIYCLATKYPQGSEKHIIKAISGREVPSGKLPIDVGCVVLNVATAKAIKEAVIDGKPLIERIATITGHGIKTPKRMLIRIGTPIEHVLAQCGGFTDAEKFILGGPMMGISHFSSDTPVIKGGSGFLLLNEKEIDLSESNDCIRCGKCVSACPMRLLPLMISNASVNNDFEKAEKYNAMDCIECGACSYVCPAKRMLVSNMRVAKREITAIRKEKAALAEAKAKEAKN